MALWPPSVIKDAVHAFRVAPRKRWFLSIYRAMVLARQGCVRWRAGCGQGGEGILGNDGGERRREGETEKPYFPTLLLRQGSTSALRSVA